jgi:hypothetical protein
MKPKNFSYKTLSKLSNYSQLVIEIIDLFNNSNPPIGNIEKKESNSNPNPNNSNFTDDRLQYWDEYNSDITYGRYLEFTNIKKDIIQFWTGFSFTQKETIYCIWFKKDDIQQYIDKLKNKFHHFRQSDIEFWIPMKFTDFEDLCNGCSICIKQLVKDFWHSVLEVLQ